MLPLARRRAALLASAFGASLLVAGPALAENPVLPTGGVVGAGAATIATGDQGVRVTQSTPKSVINWNSFSVGQGRTVAFDLPSTSAAVLNRVNGDASSLLAGSLTSNGRVYLVNPNGIAITATGEVRVGGGFVASSLDISDADFLSGRTVFAGASRAEVSNAGAIYVGEGGHVALLGGGRVRNTGLISAPLGQVALGSGSAVTLDPGGDGFLQILAAPALGAEAGVDVGGQVLAAGGRVVVRADSVERTVRDLVNLTGEVSVASARAEGGTVILDAGAGGLEVSGAIDATSNEAQGGRIALGGDSVTLTGARLDASGATGGEITVGGGWQGAPVPAVTTARRTFVDSPSRLEASGTSGAGGKVILWSDDDTRFTGRILATGNGGDGGTAEVSSHGVYLFDGQVNLLSTGGRAGRLLLDPYNVTISSGADFNQTGFTATGDSAVINVTSLQNALAGASVTVSTGSSGTQAGNITLSSALSWSADTTLTLNAAGAITLNGLVTNSGTGSGLELISTTGASITAGVANSGTLTINGAGTVTSTLSGSGALVKTGAGLLSIQRNTTYTGATTVSAGTLAFESLGNMNSGNYAGNIDIAAGATFRPQGTQTLSGIISGLGTITTTGTGGQVITLTGANTFNGTIASGSASIVIGGSGVLGGGNFSGTITTQSTGGATSFRYSSSSDQVLSGVISGGGGLTKDTSASTLTLSGGAASHAGTTISAGTLVLAGASSLTQGVTTNAGGTFRVSSSTDQGPQVTGAGSFIKDTSASTFTWNSGGTFTGNMFIDAGMVDVINGSSFGTNVPVFIGPAATLRFSKWSTLTHAGTISGTGALIQNGSDITLTGANTFNGSITVVPSNRALIIGGSGVLGGGNYSGAINGAGTLNYASSANQTLSGVLSGTLSLGKTTSAASTLTLTGANTFTGGITNSAGTLVIGGSGSLGGGTYAGAISNAGTLRYSSSADQTLSGVISGAGALVKDTAASTLTLSGANTYTGATTLSLGTLRLTGANASSGIAMGAGTLLDWANPAAVSFGGVISGAGDFQKSAAGVLTLNSSNTFTGVTNVTAGTLTLIGDHASPSINISSGAVLDYGNYGSVRTYAGVISGAGAFRKSNTADLILTGVNTYSGPTSITSSGKLQIGGAGSLGAGNYGGAISGHLVYSSSSDQILSGVISGTGVLIKDTSATSILTLTGLNTNTGSITISAGELRIAGAGYVGSGNFSAGVSNLGTLRYSSSANQTFAAGISGTGVIIKDTSAASTLTLGEINTYTGATSVAAGVLKMVRDQATPSIDIAAGAVLEYSNYAATTFAGAISGAGAFLKSSNAALTLTGMNTFTGATTISAGELKIGGTGVLGSGSYAGAISNAGTLRYSSSANQTLSGVISGAGALVKDTGAASTLTLTGVNTFTGALTNTLGTLQVGGAGSLGSGTYAGAISNAGTLRYSSSADQALSGAISGAGALVKDTSASSTLTLSSASNSYSGATTISAGTLQIGGAGRLGSGIYAGAIANDGVLRFSSSNAQTFSGVISGSGSVVKDTSAASTLTLSGANTYSGGTTFGAGTVALGSAGAIGSTGSLAFTGGTLQHGASNTTDYSPRVVASGGQQVRIDTGGQTITHATGLAGAGTSLNKLGTGTLILTGASTYDGATTVTLGELRIGGSGALGGGAYAGAISNAGTLRYASSADQTLSGVISGAGALIKDTSASTLTLAGVNTFTGAITNSLGTLAIGGAGQLNNGSYSGAISNAGTLRYSSSANQTLSGVISGAGSVVKDTSATSILTLSGSNTFTGGVAFNAGAIRTNGSTAFGSGGALTFAGGILQYGGHGTDYSARFLSTGGQPIQIDTNGSSVTYGSIIAGAGTSLAKLGTGTLTLTAASTYTGATNVAGGTLSMTGTASLGGGTYAGAFNIAPGATFSHSASVNQTLSGVLSGTGAISKGNINSTLTLSGANTFNGDITILGNGGTVQVGGGGFLGGGTYSGALTINGGSLFRYSSTADQVFSGAITSGGSFTKDTAASTLTLSGAGTNTLANTTTVSAGVLRAGAANAFSSASNHAVTGTGVLDVGGFGNTIAQLSGTGTVTNNGAGPATLTFAFGSGVQTFSGVVQDGASVLSLSKTGGGGNQQFSGANTFTGGITVNGGGIGITGAGTLGGGSYAGSISVASGATFDYASSANQTISGVISGAGGLTKNTLVSTLTLTGANTYTGPTTIAGNGGTIQVGGAGVLGGGAYSGALTVNSGSTFRYSSSADQAFSGAINGGGNLTKDTAASTLTLAGGGTNTLSGTTTVSGGVLRAGAVNAFSGASRMVSDGAGVLDIGGFANTIPQISGTGFVTNNGASPAALTITLSSATQTFFGVMQDGASVFSLAKTGGGSQYLSGANTFTGGITVNGGGIGITGAGTLGGGTYAGGIAVASGATFDYASSANQTISGVISGAGGLTKNNLNSTLTLTGVNTYTGPTTIFGNGGILEVAGDGVLGGGAYGGAFSNASTFRYVSTADQVLSGALTGGGKLIKDTAPSVLSVTGSYAWGNITLNAGEFAVAGAGTFNGVAATLAAGTIFRYSSSANALVTGTWTGLGTFIKDTSASTIQFNSNYTHTGPIRILKGTLMGGSSNFAANDLYLGPDGIFDFYMNTTIPNIGVLTGSGRITTNSAVSANVNIASGDFSGVIENGAGTVGLIKNTAGTLILRGTNTFTRLLTVNAGTLEIADSSNLTGGAFAGPTTVTGTLRFSTTSDQVLSGVVSGNGALIKDTSPSTLTLTGVNTFNGPLTVGAGKVTIGGAGVLGNGTYSGALSNAGIFQFSSSAAQTMSGVISGAGSLVKDASASVLTLSGLNTFTGDITLSTGEIKIGGAGSLGGGTYAGAISNAGTLRYSSSAAQTLSGVISGAGTLVKDTSASVLTLMGANTFTGDITNTLGTLAIGSAGSLGGGTYAGAISNAGTLRYSSSVDQELSGVISGAGALVKDTSAASTLTLTGANTFTGGVTFGAGRILTGVSGALGASGSLAFTGGTLVHGTGNAADYSTRILSTGGQLVRVDTNGEDVTYASGLLGAGTSLTKLGAGDLTLTGVSTYTGDTSIVQGKLRISGAGVLGSGAYSGAISNAGTFQYGSSAAQTLSGVISGAGALVKDTSATSVLTLAGSNLFTGPVTIAAGEVQIAGAATLGAGAYAGAIQNDGTLRFSSSADQILSGAISGAGALVKDTSASSTLTLDGANTFSGRLSILAGDAELVGSWAPATGIADVTVGAGPLLSGSGVVTAASLNLTGAGHVQLTGPNQVDALAAVGTIGGVELTNARTLQVGDIDAVDAIKLKAVGSTSDIILASGTVLQSAKTGDAVVLSAGRNFLNDAGAGAIVAPGGRWLVYSTRPADNRFGGLDSAQVALWGRASMAPVSESGNRYVFSYAPTVTFDTASFRKTYGIDISGDLAAAFTFSGFDPGVSGAYRADSAATALAGSPVISSQGARADAPVGVYGVNASLGTLVPVTGYALAFQNSGVLTVDPAMLTVRARDFSRVYDGRGVTAGAGVDITGWIGGDTLASLSGALTYSGSFLGGADVGTYQIVPGGLTSDNYTLRFLPGVMTITPAPLTVTVQSLARTYDGQGFSGGGGVTYTGFVNGETASVLGGSLAYGGTAQGAVNAGTYALSASGLTSRNYTLQYVPGTLEIRPARLTVTARDLTRTYDSTAWSGGNGVLVDGLVGADTPAALGGTLIYGGSSQGAVNAGAYEITVGGLSSPNYDIRYVGGRLTIEKSVVTVAADSVTKPYDGTPFNGTTTVTVTGLAGRDSPSVLSGQLVFAGPAQGAVDVGIYEIMPSGLTSQNYEIRYLAGILQVVPAPVTATARPRLEYVCRGAIRLLGEQACKPEDPYAGFLVEPADPNAPFLPPWIFAGEGGPVGRMD